MSAPRRVQRTRKAGGGMPAGAVYVGRPTRWGNPFRVGDRVLVPGSTGGPDGAEWEVLSASRAIALYEAHIRARPKLVAAARSDLAGRDLACWCALDQPCHADVLLKIANA